MPAALQAALPAALAAACPPAPPAAAPSSSAGGGPPRCPPALEPLRELLATRFQDGLPVPCARALFTTLGVRVPAGADYAVLRVLLAAFHPGKAVHGVDMGLGDELPRVREAVDAWAERGPRQLPSLCVSCTMEPFTLLNHVSRRVYHSSAFRGRRSAALLEDALTLRSQPWSAARR